MNYQAVIIVGAAILCIHPAEARKCYTCNSTATCQSKTERDCSVGTNWCTYVETVNGNDRTVVYRDCYAYRTSLKPTENCQALLASMNRDVEYFYCWFCDQDNCNSAGIFQISCALMLAAVALVKALV